MAAASASGEKPSPGSTVSFLVAKLTELVATPGTFAAAVSTRRTQDAQVMPSTGMLIGSMLAGLTVWFMAKSLVPPLCGPSHDGKVKAMGEKISRGLSDRRPRIRPRARHGTGHNTGETDEKDHSGRVHQPRRRHAGARRPR